MKVYNFEQNSPEWEDAHRGVITASCFDKVITAKTEVRSKTCDEIEDGIVAEILTKQANDGFGGNMHTRRGHQLEPEASKFYEFENDVKVELVGFVTNDEGTLGASPDRLVGSDGLLEIKCPCAKTQVKNIVNPDDLVQSHKQQLQGQLLITGRKWVDILSYHPIVGSTTIRVERDEEYIKKLGDILNEALDNIQTKLDIIRNK